MKENYIDRSKEIMCGEPVFDSHISLELHHKDPQDRTQRGRQLNHEHPDESEGAPHPASCRFYFAMEREFPPSEIEFFTAMANEAAVAIENAKLYEHLNKKYNNLVEDIFLWYDGTSRGMDY